LQFGSEYNFKKLTTRSVNELCLMVITWKK